MYLQSASAIYLIKKSKIMNKNFSNSETEYVSVKGSDIAYRQFGAGEPIIFYHRFRGVMDYWDPLFLDTLAKNYHVVVFDYPGVGNSQGELSPDIYEVANTGVQLMESLGFLQFFVGGWSYGGLVAQAAMFLHTQKVMKCILIGTNPPGANEIPMEPIFGKYALKPEYDLEDETVLFFEPKSPKSRLAALRSHERIAPRLDWSLVPSTQEVFQRYMAGMAMFAKDEHNFREQYKNLKTPVFIISGDHDISFNTENWTPLLKNAPGIQHLIINDAGHGSHHQHPGLVAGYIHLFLSQNE